MPRYQSDSSCSGDANPTFCAIKAETRLSGSDSDSPSRVSSAIVVLASSSASSIAQIHDDEVRWILTAYTSFRSDPDVAFATAQALRPTHYHATSEIIGELIRMAEDVNASSSARTAALESLLLYGAARQKEVALAVPGLIKIAASGSSDNGWNAWKALMKIGVASRSSYLDIVRRLDSDLAELRGAGDPADIQFMQGPGDGINRTLSLLATITGSYAENAKNKLIAILDSTPINQRFSVVWRQAIWDLAYLSNETHVSASLFTSKRSEIDKSILQYVIQDAKTNVFRADFLPPMEWDILARLSATVPQAAAFIKDSEHSTVKRNRAGAIYAQALAGVHITGNSDLGRFMIRELDDRDTYVQATIRYVLTQRLLLPPRDPTGFARGSEALAQDLVQTAVSNPSTCTASSTLVDMRALPTLRDTTVAQLHGAVIHLSLCRPLLLGLLLRTSSDLSRELPLLISALQQETGSANDHGSAGRVWKSLLPIIVGVRSRRETDWASVPTEERRQVLLALSKAVVIENQVLESNIVTYQVGPDEITRTAAIGALVQLSRLTRDEGLAIASFAVGTSNQDVFGKLLEILSLNDPVLVTVSQCVFKEPTIDRCASATALPRTLHSLSTVLQNTNSTDELRKKAQVTAATMLATPASADLDRSVLSELASSLDAVHLDASFVRSRMSGAQIAEARGAILKSVLSIAAVQCSAWIVLLLFYPRNKAIRRLILSNDAFRKWFGLLYVQAIISLSPALQRHLLLPYRERLSSGATSLNGDSTIYFDSMTVRRRFHKPGSDDTLGAASLVSGQLWPLQGHIVLQGRSGSGKTTVAKQLVRTSSKRIITFIRADRCDDGVEAAIQERLSDFRDIELLINFIKAGSIDVIIDGLNEASSAARIKVSSFLEMYSDCAILVTTQPMFWNPPRGTVILDLQPLTSQQILDFLNLEVATLLRDGGSKSDFKEQRDAMCTDPSLEEIHYRRICERYCATQMAPHLPAPLLNTNIEVLSNPIDLNIAAQVLCKAPFLAAGLAAEYDGSWPQVSTLEQTRFDMMARSFSKRSNGIEFPIATFSDIALTCLVTNKRTFTSDEISALQALREYSMAIAVPELDSSLIQYWRFRHDTVLNFFAAHTFLNQDTPNAAVWSEHLADARFKDVYISLAARLGSDDEVERLGRLIRERAVLSGDHSLDDAFFLVAEARFASSRLDTNIPLS